MNPERPGELLGVGHVIVVSMALVGACIALGEANVFGTTETTAEVDDDVMCI